MNKNESKNKGAIMQRLEAMGFKTTPKDHPVYKLGPSIRFVNKRPLNKKNGEGDE